MEMANYRVIGLVLINECCYFPFPVRRGEGVRTCLNKNFGLINCSLWGSEVDADSRTTLHTDRHTHTYTVKHSETHPPTHTHIHPHTHTHTRWLGALTPATTKPPSGPGPRPCRAVLTSFESLIQAFLNCPICLVPRRAHVTDNTRGMRRGRGLADSL